MTLTDSTATLGASVPIENIEKELRKLWEADEARTNASLMNLAVYSEEVDSLAKNSSVVRELTEEHACRALLIEMDKNQAQPTAKSWVTAHCHLAHGQKSVCCEQIAFQLTGQSRGRFRNTIFAHLQSDLPLVFWWQGGLSSLFSESLYRRIDRLVVDSSSWSDVKKDFASVIEAMSSVNLVVQDLAWTRTFHYRLAVASVYDDLIAQSALPDTKKISVTAHKDHKNSALLMVAWFTQLAGWSQTKGSADHTAYQFTKPDGQTVEVEIEYRSDCAPLAKFEVISDRSNVVISREINSKQLLHQFTSNGSSSESHGPSDSDECSKLVASQLSRGGKNSLYRRVLMPFIEMLG